MPDKAHEQTDKELKRLERQITKEYSQAAKEVEKKLTDYLEKFAKKDAEMQKKVASGQMSAEEYGKWRIGQMAMGERWKEMQKTLTEDLVNADKIAAGMINDSLPSAYALNYNYGTYEVEHGARINTSFTLYDHSTVENLMKKDPKIIPQARVDIPKDELWNRRKLTSAITQGILQGESIPKIAKRLGSVADMDRKAAIRNARTYTTAAENKGRIDSYDRAEQMGIKVKKKWMATLDDRTRVEHRHLDGQVRDNDEPFETDGYEIMYPGDPSAEPEMIYNCRCTLVAEIEGYQYQDERNDSKLGDMTYEEWKHAKDKSGMEPVKEESKFEFIPAKNIQEAEEYAKQFAEDVNYKGMSLEKVNEINKQLTVLTEKYPIKKLDIIDQKGGNQSASANYHKLTFNKFGLGKALEDDYAKFLQEQEQTKQAIENIKSRYPNGRVPSSMQDRIDKLERRLNFDRWGVLDSYDNQLAVLVTHEYGHIIADQYFAQINSSGRNLSIYQYSYKKTNWSIAYQNAQKNGDIYKISKYGSTNEKEFFAECFAAREFGEELPDYVERLMEDTLNGKPL